MDYKDRVNAIVCAYYPGMQGGKVFTDILFGDVNPSGKLPLSWPKYYRDCPSYRNFGGEAREVLYGEGIYVGYRYYDMKHVEPLYPFGYGLSYTSFEIQGAQVRDTINVDAEDVKVSVTVKNTGTMDGSEVVQLYIHDVIARQEKPDKELKAFQKVFVKAGQEETITLTLKKEDFASWSPEIKDWATEPGEYELLIGNSSANIQICKLVNVICKNPFGLSESTSAGEVTANEAAVKMIQRITGLDVMKRLNICMVFFPQMSWKEVWGPYLGDVLKDEGKTDADVEKLYQEILAEFAKFNE
ncbi:MAG: hypothetical protein HFI32_07930 [Lachnospiraceae bacterium]|nr:hypothetical protein [Lachnospiraceae bacterium]